MELKVFARDGKEVDRTVQLDDAVFGIEPNDHVIWLDVKSIQANARQGTHKTKERSEVRGGGRKPWRQKGTGRARVGTIRSPLWVGGGSIFGPRPHKYTVAVNRKTKHLARRSAFSYKAKGEAIRIVEDFDMEAPRTREIAALVDSFEAKGRRVLLLTAEPSHNIYKSGRNIQKFVTRDAASASTVDIMNAQVLLVQESALEVLSRVLGNGQEAAAETEETTE